MIISNTNAFLKFLDECRSEGIYPRSMRCTKGGRPLLSVDFPPYDGAEPMHVYSLSKSFTSVAVGVAVDEGLLSLEERMCDIFPDKMPRKVSENLSQMKLKDVLSMQSGHNACALEEMLKNRESLKTFFSREVEYRPGTKFVYSTGGTLICGAAVTRRSGMPLDEFLYDRVFAKMGIKKPYWEKTDDGLCMGGVGLHISADDILKFGEMLLGEGVYGGRRIISAEYIREASVPHSVDVNNGSEDWVAGYGYQFWMNAKGGYRGDGAYGQLCIMLPETDTVFVMMCECGDMQREYSLIMRLIDGLLTDDQSRLSEAEAAVRNFYAVPRTSLPKEQKYYFANNDNRLVSLSLTPDGDRLKVDIGCDFGTQTIICGNGEYVRSSCLLYAMSPCIVSLHKYGTPEEFNVFASYSVDVDGISITLLHSDLPHGETWRISGNKLTVKARYGGLKQTEFELIN